MKVIRPFSPELIETSVAANPEPEWAIGTTYFVGAEVQVTDKIPHKVYRSLRGGNIGHYPPESTDPKNITATSSTSHESSLGTKTFVVQSGKGFSPGMVVKIAKTTTPRTVNMTAEVISYAGTSLQVSVYAKVGEGTHNSWTVTTEDEVGFWEEIGATNQYACLDEYLNTQTQDTGEIRVKLSVERVDHVALFGLVGGSIEMTLWDESGTTSIWETTINLAYGQPGVDSTSWWEYFFGEFSLLTDIHIPLGVALAAGVLEIAVIGDDEAVVAVGNIVVGRAHDLGIATYGMSASVLDYSMRETDDKGRTKLEQGPWAKRAEIDLNIPSGQVNRIYDVLASLRGIPTAWISVPGESRYEPWTVYGSFREFDITVPGHTRSWCRLEIEGLI